MSEQKRDRLALRRLGRDLLINGSLVLLAVLLALVLAELLVRTTFPAPPPVASAFSYRIPDPVLGWRLEPGARIQNENWEFSVPVEINTQGWRDAEHQIAKPAGTYRVLVFGDSFMEAYSVRLEDTFAQQLQLLLSRAPELRGKRVEVINLGVGGYGTLQEYLAYTEYGQQYDPDLVLVGFYVANDLADNDHDLSARLYGGSKVDGRPFLLPLDQGAWTVSPPDYATAEAEYAHYQAQLPDDVGRWWVTLAVARAAAEGRDPRWYERTALGGVVSLAALGASQGEQVDRAAAVPGFDRRAWLGVNACAPLPEYERAWGATERILVRFAADVQAAGAQFVVFSVPAYHEADGEFQAAVLNSTPDAASYCLDSVPGYQRLAAVLAADGVPYVDLLPAFRETIEGDAPLFRVSDYHWNPEGHALAARTVYAALAADGLLSPAQPGN